ncbi:MAG TPA: DUF4352 domain-containing protein [Anaerolineae bacterium]|nr:DUF4352 domain-containing protein [Anaerolineae bacterium]
MGESTPIPSPERPLWTGRPGRGWLWLIPVIGLILLLLVAVALIIVLGLRSVFGEPETDPGMPVQVVKYTPAPSTSPVRPPSCETIISSGDVQVAVALPLSLTVSSRAFPVVVVVAETGQWTYPPGYPGSAAWACGTVVNYVVGLEPVPENETLLTGLRPGDEIQLVLSNGVTLSFRFVERREVAANEASVFEQVRPRLTLVLEGEGGAWQVATADYVAETEPVELPSRTLAQVGQPVRVGDAQVTVTSGGAGRGGLDLQPGTMVYLVEFSVEDVGTTPLDATAFDMQLQDGAGNGYLLSPAASAAGEHGPLSGEIPPGTAVEGTAGYLVPETLAGPTLIWTFSPQPGSEARASVSIPYEAASMSPSAGQVEVAITDAFLSDDGQTLVVEGEIRNIGEGPLTVELGDVRLTSSDGTSDLAMAAPPLPWTVQPGQVQVIELQYARPQASAALLSILGYSFEIQGLQ